MKRIFTQGLLAVNMLVFSTVAFAGFGENKWNFAPNESVTIGMPSTIQQGFECGCEKFNPETVSFTLSYTASSDLEKLKIVADDENKITHDKENKIFILKDVKSLVLGFPGSGSYIFKNITNTDVIGIECDAGDF
ncbi:Uncharacterised protein [Candidatus Bartonella washoeensis]|uniref:Uncharacterized protein n=1 Tax=Candidatus Bartonella washoeensis Sb944nv TaxID=1094563 RepID=J1JAK6_9HYPH|nr:hypothetical protein [Bartonella washoeensis]EJF81387.1 hypothetical protein MCQ_00085 [Bartonella washoeensis Sb944nv]SPU27252.1 Uncharacterised protein [Bartonella washoeensis]